MAANSQSRSSLFTSKESFLSLEHSLFPPRHPSIPPRHPAYSPRHSPSPSKNSSFPARHNSLPSKNSSFPQRESSLPTGNTGTFSAEDFKSYEHRLNNTQSSNQHSTESQHVPNANHLDEEIVEAEFPNELHPGFTLEASMSTSCISLPPKKSGAFTAEDFCRYEVMIEAAKPITEPKRVLQRPECTVVGASSSVEQQASFSSWTSASTKWEDPITKVGNKPSVAQKARFTSSTTTSTGKGESTSKGYLQLPRKRQNRPIRTFRYTLWNVYRRLFTIVFLANAIALILYFRHTPMHEVAKVNIWNLATAASANIFIATAIRQDYIQGVIYYTAWLVPHSFPLRLRRIIAKVYENGGVHSGCAVAGTIWFTALTVIISIQYGRGISTSVAVLVLTCILQSCLLIMVTFAYPPFRAKTHNLFEISHRFGGWSVIILFWVELGLLAKMMAQRLHTSTGLVLVKQPSFWFLVLTTFHTILPWLNLRRWEFESERLSNHAVRLHFKKKVRPFTGIAISISPLLEWHPFATMPSLVEERSGGSLIVSAAGDWTNETVKNPRRYYWVKGIPKPGVLSMSLIFKRVVIVTTGSGIGPCLSIMASPLRKTECRVLWSSPSPGQIFGLEIVESVRKTDPSAVIIDSRAEGRPDMVAWTYQLYVESGAEAVFVISNPKLTRKIVYSMESRGVPGFGPVWDS